MRPREIPGGVFSGHDATIQVQCSASTIDLAQPQLERIIPDHAANASPAMLITGLPRCGSSWVGQVLGISPGVRYRYESFNPDWVPALKNQITHFKYLSPQSQPISKVAELLSRAAQGKQSPKQLVRAAYRGYWRAATRPQGRLLIKDPTACLLAGWLAERASLQVLVLVRHPCGFASSVAQLGWKFDLQRLLGQESLMTDHLADYEPVIRASIKDPWEARGAFWAAIHIVLMNQSTTANDGAAWNWCSYETLCTQPVSEFASLADQCGLPAIADTRLVSSGRHSEDPGSTRRISSKMPDIWKSRMSAGQIDAVMGVVRAFKLQHLAAGNLPTGTDTQS